LTKEEKMFKVTAVLSISKQEAAEMIAMIANEDVKASNEIAARAMGYMRSLIDGEPPIFSSNHAVQTAFLMGFMRGRNILAQVKLNKREEVMTDGQGQSVQSTNNS
jgi:hypothetical protein